MTDGNKTAAHRATVHDRADDVPANPDYQNTIGDVIHRRYGRRNVVKGGLGVAAATVLFGTAALTSCSNDELEFDEIWSGYDPNHHVPSGFDAEVLLKWGDPLFDDSPDFDPGAQSAESQMKQFGYNNDYIGFFPIEGKPDRAILCVNHEYTIDEWMFPEITDDQRKVGFKDMTKALVDTEMAAHGITVVELVFSAGRWQVDRSSNYNRRISPLETAMTIDGPAAGDRRMKTSADPTGKQVIGTINNCAGGVTPWGTYLTAEENFHNYFLGSKRDDWPSKRYKIPAKKYGWGRFHDRFDTDKEPNEPNRYGWIVEIDPKDPASIPVKHTALGRFCHEGAETVLNKDGHVVVYCGDDGRFEYIYRFVSQGKFDPHDAMSNRRLLSEGTLSVAKFLDDGTLEWLDLIYGKEPLIKQRGFTSQADVLIDARIAADLVGATPMDRPEDVQPNEKTGKVYALLTNNSKRKPGNENPANKRPRNLFGHIVEMTPPEGDHSARVFTWDILLQCGDPAVEEVGALWHPETSDHGWFACPDNCAVDREGRLWVATDQGSAARRTGKADGLYAVEVEGEKRGKSKMFFDVQKALSCVVLVLRRMEKPCSLPFSIHRGSGLILPKGCRRGLLWWRSGAKVAGRLARHLIMPAARARSNSHGVLSIRQNQASLFDRKARS